MTLLVQGGPGGAGPMKRMPRDQWKARWLCACGISHPPYYVRCERCGNDRPKENAHGTKTA